MPLERFMRQQWKCLLMGISIIGVLVILLRHHGNLAMSQPHELHPHAAELKTEAGQWKYTNALAKETSPYLLQHAHNPVDWYAWSPEAFDAARLSGKPIFLSIGYSTCYWCHVMERQCFENPRIATQMNEQFICIKVDREERPDIDDIYMAATVMVNRGRGGWPMSVFLTPPGAEGPEDKGLKPFFAGTYFPPESRHGSPGFPQLMDHLSKAWKEQRAEVIASANQISEQVGRYLGRRDAEGVLGPESINASAEQLIGSYDPVHGGFGSAPKFPTPNNLQFLMRVYHASRSADLGKALRHTLERMARGGMYDQVGGGFHRYSVDDKWLVPHFEKMLYDNGQLVEVYLEAEELLPAAADPQVYRRVVREICDYVLREMTDSTGTFWSAQDAEVDAREGGSYLWTPEEVREAVGEPDLGAKALEMYGLDQGTNFTDPHAPDEPPSNVLFLPERLDTLAARWDWTLGQAVEARRKINAKMYTVRRQRKQPSTDDKVLAAWNGIMIAGMARAGHLLVEHRYVTAAAGAARYILSDMRGSHGGLYRSMRGGRVKIDGFLEDYAYFVHGLLALHRADGRAAWLDSAVELTDLAHDRFGAEGGGYFDTLADQPDVIVRTRGTSDTAIPSGNSQMVHNLVDLFELTRERRFLERATEDLQSFAGSLAKNGAGMAHMQHALMRVLAAAPQAMPMGTAMRGEKPPLKIDVTPPLLDLSGGEGRVRVTIHIAPPYHLNAHDPGIEGLVGMQFELRHPGTLMMKIRYPEGIATVFPYAEEPISIYEGSIDVDLAFTLGGATDGPFEPRLVLKYQMCTEDTCLAPAEAVVPLRLTNSTPSGSP